MLLFGYFLLGASHLARGSSLSLETPYRAGATSGFTIADFDGDHKPDFATVYSGRTSQRESLYWICFQLSSGSTQTVGLTAPIGGLQVDPRDVNGDHFTDLVVSTSWLGKTVAVLLNDGHGNFVSVDPDKFPRASTQLQDKCYEPATRPRDVSALPPSRYKTNGSLAQSLGSPSSASPEVIFPPSIRDCAFERTFVCAGRAPPGSFPRL